MLQPERDLHPLAQRETDGVERIHELRELIADLPARTPEGLRAKAKVALVDMSEDGSGTLEPVDHQQWIGWSLARDVLGRAVG